MLKYSYQGVLMHKILALSLILLVPFTSSAQSCIEEETSKAKDDYAAKLEELKAQVFKTQYKIKPELKAEDLAREYHADLGYFESNVRDSLNNKDRALIKKGGVEALKNPEIEKKIKHSAEILGMDYVLDETGASICSQSYENAQLRVSFCEYLEIPTLRPSNREWGEDDYVRTVMVIHNSKDGSDSKGKRYKGVDFKYGPKKYSKLKAEEICSARAKDTPRGPKETEVPPESVPSKHSNQDKKK